MNQKSTGCEEDRYLPKKETIEYTGLCSRSLDNAVAKGELPAFRLKITGEHSRKILFRKSDIDAWIERHRVGTDLDKLVDEVMNDFQDDK